MAVPAEDQGYEPEQQEPFARLGLGYVFRPRDHAVRLRIDYVDRGHGDITGMLLVESALPGIRQHLHQAKFNVTSTQTRSSLAKHLAKLTPSPGSDDSLVPWTEILESFCAGVIQAELAPEPVIRVGRMPKTVRTPDRIDGLLEEGKPNSFYGPGAAGKGYLAVLMCVCIKLGLPFLGRRVVQGNPLYGDWEDDPEVLDRRIKFVCAGLGVEPPEIDYQPMRTALRYQVNQLAETIDRNENDVFVVDSVERAIGASSDAGTYEALAKSLFESLGLLNGVTSILIDHVSDSAMRNVKGVNKAYGSIMKGNWCRRAWEVKSVPDDKEPIRHVGLYQFKANHAAPVKPFGILMDFRQEDRVLFSREDLASIPVLSAAMRIEDRIAAVLRMGSLSSSDIADAAGLEQDAVRATVNRLARQGKTFVKLPDGTIGLLDERQREPIPIRPEAALESLSSNDGDDGSDGDPGTANDEPNPDF